MAIEQSCKIPFQVVLHVQCLCGHHYMHANAGMFAGTVQSTVITPVDLLKIRMQMQTAPRGSPDYTGSLQMLKRVIQREGFSGVSFQLASCLRIA